MKRLRLSADGRAALRQMGSERLILRSDSFIRFRNALLALALTDPHWMIWVEENLPNDITLCTHPWILHMLESVARYHVLKHYRFFHRDEIGWLIFRHDWPFTDRGTLSPG